MLLMLLLVRELMRHWNFPGELREEHSRLKHSSSTLAGLELSKVSEQRFAAAAHVFTQQQGASIMNCAQEETCVPGKSTKGPPTECSTGDFNVNTNVVTEFNGNSHTVFSFAAAAFFRGYRYTI